MPSSSRHEVLVVDDDQDVCDILVLLLRRSGYEVSSARHGLDALSQLITSVPDVLISDLYMPQMSGFELLSVVRRRFPQICAIAMSGALFQDGMLDGLIADAFYNKGQSSPDTLLHMVAELIQTSAARALDHERKSATVWIPRSGNDAHGIPYVVLNCPGCLRSFPLTVEDEDLQKIREAPCLFCPNIIRYIIDFSLAIASPRPEAEKMFRTKSPGSCVIASPPLATRFYEPNDE